ncbi:PopZ family protein, partial [Bradyrhizobium acaciae]|uniref:PopZ family protein n=1 Tax=Bradyrhizobium acaciae TaxID=2683706 RepID=UPI001E57F154
AAPAPKSPPPAPAPASNSQDDIDSLLASLDEATPAAEIRPSPQPEAQPEADVFELTDDMALPDPAPAPSFRKVEPQDDVEFTEARTRASEPVREPPAIEPAPMQQIISGTTMRAVESAFNSLANTVLSNNARTLEDLVKEMLRPMLKSWLDDNLPGLVERIVKAEIERVSRGR